ncbi:hypothetical protein DY000_02042116 [Brassica cretica]|uniref:Secreted protein n=1 Tax=Brassica cretica TaxID=69181 RepID=A0ABQ7BIZ9_BRACR|nr:hypothetical protein DY000_02042116 [Brassica cretica]
MWIVGCWSGGAGGAWRQFGGLAGDSSCWCCSGAVLEASSMASSRRCCGLPLNLLSSSCPIDAVSWTVVSTCSRLLHSYMNAQGLSSLGGLIGGRGIFQRCVHSCVHGDVVTLTLGQVLECFQLLCIVPAFCYSLLGLEVLSAPYSEWLGVI